MSVSTIQQLGDSREIELKPDDICIQNVSKQKRLGTYIEKNLNWSAHIDYLCSNVSSKISLWWQLSGYVSVEIQEQFYQSYIKAWIKVLLSGARRLCQILKDS